MPSERTRVESQTAFILHRRAYRETSFLIDLFSRDFGKLALIFKGARRGRSKLTANLQPFVPLSVSWTGRGELQSLIGAEIIAPPLQLSGIASYCGFYLNELLDRLLHRNDPHPDLFELYQNTLVELANQTYIESTLRRFELELLNQLGFGLQLENEAGTEEPIAREETYNYHVDHGPVAADQGACLVSGSTLIDLKQGNRLSAVALREAKRLLRITIDYHLEGKPLKSRSLFAPGQRRAHTVKND